jgi:hypothetical protein
VLAVSIFSSFCGLEIIEAFRFKNRFGESNRCRNRIYNCMLLKANKEQETKTTPKQGLETQQHNKKKNES